jgi:hypothetical protein
VSCRGAVLGLGLLAVSCETAAPVEATAPEWTSAALPTRSVVHDHFALEGAVGALLAPPEGVDGLDSTRWSLRGQGVTVHFRVWTWFSPAEAEQRCRDAAGPDAVPSLALRAPTWTTESLVFAVQGSSCVQVGVQRGSELDLDGAQAVARVLVAASPTE